MGAGDPTRQPFASRRGHEMSREGAEPARIDKRAALGRPRAPFEGKPVGGRAARGRWRAGSARFCAVRDLGQLNAARACVYGVPASRSELPVEPCVAPARPRRIAARPEGCPHQCPATSEAVN